jgi:hypothetical protein
MARREGYRVSNTRQFHGVTVPALAAKAMAGTVAKFIIAAVQPVRDGARAAGVLTNALSLLQPGFDSRIVQ